MPDAGDLQHTGESNRLAHLRERLDLVVASITDYAIFMLDPERRVVTWNAGAERILGYRADEIIGRLADVVFTPEDRQAGGPEQEQQDATERGCANDERWHLRQDGTRFFGSGILTAIRDEEGQLLGFAKIMRDFTGRQREQEALRQSEERYRLLVESVKDYAIFRLDSAGLVTDWTPAAKRILGYDAAEILGRHFSIFFDRQAQLAGAPDRELTTVLRQGQFEGVGWRIRKDGSRFWSEESARAIRDDHGRVGGVSKIVRDITDRMRAEREREQLLRDATEANRIKDEFLSTISHELRTPLNAVLGWTRLIRETALDEAGRQRALAIVERNARSQAQLIDDLLDVSRIVTGKLRLQIRPVELKSVITAGVDAVRPAADAKDIRIVVDLHPGAGLFAADPDRLQQVMWNLLTNAIRFTPERGQIRVVASRLDHHIEIAISDTGSGIAADFLPFVFDRFRQAESGTTRTQAGLGLGLAIVRHLVELHGGSVSADSGGHNRGATFRVRLPITGARIDPERNVRVSALTPAEASDTLAAPQTLRGIRVLTLDDDQDTRELMATALTALEAHVVTAASVSEGLEALDSHRPDVILTDIAMPNEDGHTFLRRVRESRLSHRAYVPVAAVTAYAREADRIDALRAGFDAYLSKPIDLDELARVVRKLASPRGTGEEV